MFLLEILLALALLYLWRGDNPLHREEWFQRWVRKCGSWQWLSARPYRLGILVVCVPVLLVALVFMLIPNALVLLFASLVLVYCLGRGELGEEILPYNAAYNDLDWDRATRSAARQGVDIETIAISNWPKLHEQMLQAAAYHGFERLFAVIFWFVFLGPVGALLYRLSHAFAHVQNTNIAHQWLWSMEWIPVRVFGASLAVTGNFVGCVNRWQKHLLSRTSTTGEFLLQSVLGALSVDDELVASCDVTEREVAAIKRLYKRTLWFWLAVMAIWILFGPAELF